MTLRVLVCGGRNFNGASLVNSLLGVIHARSGIAAIVQGGASGADELARWFAERKGIPCETFPADWEVHGRAAGPIRNQRMIDEGKPDLVVAFPGGRGTEDMIRRAEKAGIPVERV